MKLWPALLVFLAGCSGCASVSGSKQLEPVALLIEMERGTCSATVVGPHTIITAAHCALGGPLLRVGGRPVKILHTEVDGNDHILVKLDVTFSRWAQVSKPVVGETVRMLGNPAELRQVYRVGIVSAINAAACPPFRTITPKPTCETIVFQLTTGGGDSGAGYFDEDGRLVAVHSASYPIGRAGEDTYSTVPVAFALAFSPEQWKAAGV